METSLLHFIHYISYHGFSDVIHLLVVKKKRLHKNSKKQPQSSSIEIALKISPLLHHDLR